MRVIAGRLGGRRLLAPKGWETRPTSDRVKEALFSILGGLDGLRVLDLYAGTGALGIEALSRGAAFAAFVEHAPIALGILKKNLEDLALAAQSSIVAARVGRAASRLSALGPFDCALADPPYADSRAALTALESLAKRGVFSADAPLVLEHETRAELTSVTLELVDRRSYGGTSLSFFRPLGDDSLGAEGAGASEAESG